MPGFPSCMRHSRLHSLPIQNSEYAAWGGRTERGWENSGQGSHRASKVQNPTNCFVDSIGSSPMRPWECLACGSPQLAHRYSQRCTQLHLPPHYLPLAGALCTPDGGKCKPLQTPSEQGREKALKFEPSATLP